MKTNKSSNGFMPSLLFNEFIYVGTIFLNITFIV